jgi:hypothetical protein
MGGKMHAYAQFTQYKPRLAIYYFTPSLFSILKKLNPIRNSID